MIKSTFLLPFIIVMCLNFNASINAQAQQSEKSEQANQVIQSAQAIQPAQAIQQIQSQPDQTPQSGSDRYLIDPEHTFSSFEYQHWGLSKQRGRFDKSTGVLELNMKEKTGSLKIDVDANSVSTGVEIFNATMRSDSFFDAEKYPKISFQSNQFIFDKDQLSQVKGQLSIKGITRPVVIDVTYFACKFMFIYLKKACGANGKTSILRSDFNVGRYVPFVSDEITLYFSVEAIKANKE